MEYTLEILIAFFSTIFGAVLSAVLSDWLSKNPFFGQRKIKTEYSGTLRELNLSQLSPQHGHNEENKYKLIKFTITKSKKNVKLDVIYESRKKNRPKVVKIGEIEGVGDLVGDFAYITYKGSYKGTNRSWSGCIVIQIDQYASVRGHWLSAHRDGGKDGPIALGEIDVRET